MRLGSKPTQRPELPAAAKAGGPSSGPAPEQAARIPASRRHDWLTAGDDARDKDQFELGDQLRGV